MARVQEGARVRAQLSRASDVHGEIAEFSAADRRNRANHAAPDAPWSREISWFRPIGAACALAHVLPSLAWSAACSEPLSFQSSWPCRPLRTPPCCAGCGVVQSLSAVPHARIRIRRPPPRWPAATTTAARPCSASSRSQSRLCDVRHLRRTKGSVCPHLTSSWRSPQSTASPPSGRGNSCLAHNDL